MLDAGKIIYIVEIYAVNQHHHMVAVDFLREEDGVAYRRLKYFYADDWQDIAVAGQYEKYQEHDSDDTVIVEK